MRRLVLIGLVMLAAGAAAAAPPDGPKILLLYDMEGVTGASSVRHVNFGDQSFDAIVAVATHAGAGNPDGFLAHTYTIQDIGYRVNGIPFNESMILATGAARAGIPLIMVCGDDVLETEIRRFLPWVAYATVKRAENRAKAEPLPRAEASRRIEEAARKALQSLDRARLPEIARAPFRFVLTFQNDGQARAAGVIRSAGHHPKGGEDGPRDG